MGRERAQEERKKSNTNIYLQIFFYVVDNDLHIEMFKMNIFSWHWCSEFSEDSRQRQLWEEELFSVLRTRRTVRRLSGLRSLSQSSKFNGKFFRLVQCDRPISRLRQKSCFFFIDAVFWDFVLFILHFFLLTCLLFNQILPPCFSLNDYSFWSLSNVLSFLIVIKYHLQANERNCRELRMRCLYSF